LKGKFLKPVAHKIRHKLGKLKKKNQKDSCVLLQGNIEFDGMSEE